jgi:hypothetical protein
MNKIIKKITPIQGAGSKRNKQGENPAFSNVV